MEQLLESIQKSVDERGFGERIVAHRSLGGGHGQRVVLIELDNGRSLAAKCVDAEEDDRLNAEADGLVALSNQIMPLRVPQVWGVTRSGGAAVMLMELLEPARWNALTDRAWREFGLALADKEPAMRRPRYGWNRDNFIGATPQPNRWCDDWVEFNRVQRIGFQLALAEGTGALSTRDGDVIRRVMDRLDTFIPRHPEPALLHGDLWSGNAHPFVEDGQAQIALIDPAVYVGDIWADLAMMRLFGGFPESCLRAFEYAVADKDHAESRQMVYQLYHALNHVNIFGAAYVEQTIGLAKRLLG
jgi:fructosamine-3-kinase